MNDNRMNLEDSDGAASIANGGCVAPLSIIMSHGIKSVMSVPKFPAGSPFGVIFHEVIVINYGLCGRDYREKFPDL